MNNNSMNIRHNITWDIINVRGLKRFKQELVNLNTILGS